MRLGASTMYSSQEVADAFLTMQKAGLSAGEIMDGALAAGLQVAGAEGMNMADAAEIMANALMVFGDQGVTAAMVSDQLAAGALASSSSVEDLGFSLKYASGSAATLGVPMEDLITSIALLSNAGLKGSTAGTSMNNVLLAMASPTKAAAKEMEKLGISYKDASGEIKPLPQIFSEMNAAMEGKGYTQAEKLASLKDLFNTRGARAAAILLKEVNGEYEAMGKTIQGSAGKGAELMAARMESFAGSLEIAKGAIETFMIALGLALQPLIEFFAGAIAAVAQWFTNLPKPMQTAIAAFLVFAAVIGPIVLLLGFMITAVTSIIGAVTAAAAAIGIGVAAFLGWIAVIALVIAAVVAVVVLIIKNWDKIKAYFVNLFAQWKRDFPALFTFITTAVRVFVTVIKAWFSALVTAWKTTFTVIWNIVKTSFDIISKIFGTVFGIWMTVIDTALKAIAAMFRGDWGKVAEIVKDGASKILGYVKALPGQILSALGNLGSLLYGKGRELMNGLWEGIKSVVDNIKNTIKSAVGLSPSVSSSASGVASVGLSTFGITPASTSSSRVGSVVINVNGAQDPYTTARIVKRAVEGYDVSQGRKPAQALARAW
jgi:TP901 family phage tail tape measure protein